MAPYDAELLDGADPGWREFLLGHPDALPYHHPAWVATLAAAYGFEPRAAIIRGADGEIAGGIPLIELGGRIRGRRWVSLPFTDFCPPLATDAAEHELGVALERLREEREIASHEVRAPLAGRELGAAQRGVRHILPLADPDDLFRGFRSQVRRNVRKAERSGIEVRRADTRDELTRTYFGLHADTRRRLGVPPQPRRFFEQLWKHALEPGFGYLLLAYRGGTAVAGAVFLEWNGRIVYKYGASDREHWSLRPNNLLFWQCIRERAAAGALSLDFGRSDLEDEGLRAFKAGWGAAEQPLYYTHLGSDAIGRDRVSGGAQLLRPIVKGCPIWVGRMLGLALYRHTA
jgi:CelD/BcsL family acetyltransferase involved in cellulose biosynthesis